jgi:hypothetical protein
MYEIKRANNRVTITKGRDSVVFDAVDTAYVIYQKKPTETAVEQVKNLADADLLLALAHAIFIKE